MAEELARVTRDSSSPNSRMRKRHRSAVLPSLVEALSRRIMLNFASPSSSFASLLPVLVAYSAVISLMGSALAKPLVDPGVFVIEGVSSCRNGAGYCVLGSKCSVDGDFVDDDEFGHCDGLRNAFSPSALFVCCKYIGEEADAIAKAKTKLPPVQSYLLEKIEGSNKPGAVVHLVEVLDVVTDSTGVLDVVTRPFEGTQEEFLRQPPNARPPNFNVTWLEEHLAALAAGGAAAPASTLPKHGADQASDFASSPILGPFQDFLANNNVRKVRAAKIRPPNQHGFVLTAIKTEKKQQHDADQAYVGSHDVEEDLSERIVHDLPTSDIGVGPVDDPIFIRFLEDPAPAQDDEEEPDFGDFSTPSPSDGEDESVDDNKEASGSPTDDGSTAVPAPPTNTSSSTPAAAEPSSQASSLPIMMNHPEMQFNIGRPKPSPAPEEEPVLVLNNDLPQNDDDDDGEPDDSIVVFDDEAFGPDGIPPEPSNIVSGEDLGPIIHFPGSQQQFPLPVNQTTTSTSAPPPITITTPAAETTTLQLLEVTDEPSSTSESVETTTVAVSEVELTTVEDVSTTTIGTTVELSLTTTTDSVLTTVAADETTLAADEATTEQTTTAAEQTTTEKQEETTVAEATTTAAATTEAELSTTAGPEETTTAEPEVVTEAPTTTESNVQQPNVTGDAGDLVIVFPNNTVPVHQLTDGGPQIVFPAVGAANDEGEEPLTTTEQVTVTTSGPTEAMTESTTSPTDEEQTTLLTTEAQAPTTEESDLTTSSPDTAAAGDETDDESAVSTTAGVSSQPPTTTSASTAVDDGTTVSDETTQPADQEQTSSAEQATTEPGPAATTATEDLDQASVLTTASPEAQETTTLAPVTETEAPESTTTASEEVSITTSAVVPVEEEVTTTELPVVVSQDSTTVLPTEAPPSSPEITSPSPTPPSTTPQQSVPPSSPSTLELFEAPTKLPHPIGQFEEGDTDVTDQIDVPELISPAPPPNESSGEVEMVTTVPIDSMIKPQQCGIHGRYLTLPESRALRINALDYLRGAPEARFGSYIHSFGGPSQARIIGGRVTSTVIWCWMAAFMAKNPGAGQDTFLCSGALIENDLVISTASCLKKLFDRGLSNFRVVLGDSNLKVNLDLDNNKVVQARDIQEVIIHENYGMDKGIPLNDIGIAKLVQPIEITPTVCLLCLPTETKDFSHKYCTVTGYGKSVFDDSSIRNTQYIDEFSEGVLRQASLPIMAGEDCSSTVYNTSKRHATAVHPSLLCTGASSGQVACIKSLDAGSPLACHDENGQYVLAGVLSYNLDCGRPLPSLYTRVSTFLRWVRINYMRMLGFIIDNEFIKP